MIYQKRAFPIISIGCNKCESFPGKKPEGCESYMRAPNQVTQDLWDVMVVAPHQEEVLSFIRFGAGENVTIHGVFDTRTKER
jgi:hypothetical protein